MRKRRHPMAARHRRRNPRTGTSADPPAQQAGTEPSLEEILEVSRQVLVDARAMLESTAAKGEADASLKAYLLRVVAQLDALLERATVSERDFELFAMAWSTFTPVLDLEWLPADSKSFTPLPQREMECIAMLRHERAAQAAKRESNPSRGPLDGLLDLISESLEVFMLFGYRDGVTRCIELNEVLLEQAGASGDGDA